MAVAVGDVGVNAIAGDVSKGDDGNVCVCVGGGRGNVFVGSVNDGRYGSGDGTVEG